MAETNNNCFYLANSLEDLIAMIPHVNTLFVHNLRGVMTGHGFDKDD